LKNGKATDFAFNLTGKFDEHFVYDKHGNIETLRRYQNAQLMDDLVLSYSGNQLQSVSDAAGGENQYYIKEYQDFANESVEMEYDANGNLIKDLDRKILKIEYNLLNLPSRIFFKGGNEIINIYAADGRKLEAIYITKTTENIEPIERTLENESNIRQILGTYYFGNIEYEYYKLIYRFTPSLTRVSNSEGYYGNNEGENNYSFYYYRKDHL
jgi:hypothetical protein